MPMAVMVPVHLHARYLSAPTPVVAPTLPYDHLPHHWAGRVQNPNVPYLASSLARDAFNETGATLSAGIHLHWSMPDALTRQDADGTLPRLPNRWAIKRTGGGLAARVWMIESDALRFGPDPGDAAACILIDGDPGFGWLGYTAEVTGYAPEDNVIVFLGDRHKPLTIDCGGEIMFAALYSRSAGVFGFHDGEIIGDVPAELTYVLYGHHADGDDDPLTRLVTDSSPIAQATLERELGWTLDNPEEVERSVYYAAIDFPNGTPLPWTTPNEAAQVALGNTTVEALAALLGHNDPDAEEALAAIRYLATRGDVDTDLEHAMQEFRHSEGFHAEDGGRHWTIRPGEPAPGAPPSPPVSVADGHDIATALQRLNAAQGAYDSGRREIARLRDQLYADWTRYLQAMYPHEGARLAEFPDIDDARQVIEHQDLEPLEALLTQVGEVRWHRDSHDSVVQPLSEPGITGTRAAEVVAAWHDVYGRLETAGAGTTEYVLIAAPASRFFSPRELSVVLRGELVESTVRHGADGRLHSEGFLVCGSRWVVGPSAIGSELDGIFGWIHARYGVGDERNQHNIGFTRVLTQPWEPLVLQWTADFEPLTFERSRAGAGSYADDFLTSRFGFDSHRPELIATDPDNTAGPVPVAGWSIVSTGAARALRADLDRYLDDHEKHGGETSPTIEQLRDTRNALAGDGGALAATLNGFHDELLMYRRGPQLPIRDPLALPQSPYERLAHRVHDLLGQPTGRAPDPALEFHPLRTGLFRLDTLRLIDNFGLERAVTLDPIIALPQTMPRPPGEHHAFLPPRLLAPARLTATWTDPATARHDEPDDAPDHPSFAPVHGWLVVDRVDERILFYDGDGSLCARLALEANDELAATRIRPVLIDPTLDAVIDRLAGDRSWYEALTQAIDDSQELIDPGDAGHHRGIAMLASRPLAIATMRLGFEFSGAPPHAHDWHSFQSTIAGEGRQWAGLERVEFPVRLGSAPPDSGRTPRLDDGLIGFWAGDDRLRTPKSSVSHTRLVEFDGGNDDRFTVNVNATDPAVTVTMLLDPRGTVHATSGVLPTKRIRLDPTKVAAAMRRLEVMIDAGPILTRPGRIDMPQIDDPDVSWRWVEDELDTIHQAIEPLEGQPPLASSLELRHGYLAFRPLEDPTLPPEVS